MDDKIIELEEYRDTINNKTGLDNGTISLDELSLEEIEDVGVLYRSEVSKLAEEVQMLEEENQRLRRLLDK